jgi:DNA repair protein SbcC/Rad50
MIRKISISNFQNHLSKFLKFRKGINTIVGDSDVGKSAILRAIKWVLMNTPRGVDFVSRGEELCEVKLQFNDHTIVRRKDTKKLNEYVLDTGNPPFVSFSNDVPEDVQKVTNVSDLNFQDQHNALFWFDKSSSDVSKEINKLVDLEKADIIIFNSKKLIREAKTLLKGHSDKLIELHKDLEETEGVEESKVSFDKAHSLFQKMTGTQNKMSDLSVLCQKILTLDTNVAVMDRTLDEVTVPDIKEWVEARDHLSDLEDLTELVINTKIPDKPIEMPDIDYSACLELSAEIERIDNLVISVEMSHAEIARIKAKIEENKLNLEELTEQLEVEVCPTCGRNL